MTETLFARARPPSPRDHFPRRASTRTEDPLANLELTDGDSPGSLRSDGRRGASRHGRIVSTLEGGYALAALGRSCAVRTSSARLQLCGVARPSRALSERPAMASGREALFGSRNAGAFWRCAAIAPRDASAHPGGMRDGAAPRRPLAGRMRVHVHADRARLRRADQLRVQLSVRRHAVLPPRPRPAGRREGRPVARRWRCLRVDRRRRSHAFDRRVLGDLRAQARVPDARGQFHPFSIRPIADIGWRHDPLLRRSQRVRSFRRRACPQRAGSAAAGGDPARL